jgi:DNA-binding NarL/FixJ family response regulator
MRRVVIADDHVHYRRALGRMLRAGGVDVVAEVANGDGAVRAASVTVPDVLLLDLYMPGMSCAEAARLVARRSPATAIVVLSVYAEEADVVDAMVAGACGYVLKGRPVEEMIAAIDAAAAGEPVMSPGIASALVRRFRDRAGAESYPPLLA